MPSLATASDGGGSAASLLILLLPLLLIGLMFWTQRKRSRQFQQAQDQLTVGDEVSTTSGLMGQLVALEGEVASLEVAPGVVVRFDRRAVVPASTAVAGRPVGGATPESKTTDSATEHKPDADPTPES